MHLVSFHRFVYVQVLQMALNLVCSHNGVPAFIFRALRDVGSSACKENLRKNVAEYIRLLHISCHQMPHLIYQGGTVSFVFLPQVTYLSGFSHISFWH